MGSTQKYIINNGNYKSEVNGAIAQWQMYLAKENKIYYKMTNSEVIQWSDASQNQDSILKEELKKNATVILGYECDELTLYCRSGVQKYYFSSKIAYDPSLFRKHRFGNWYECLKRTQALPLKIITITSQFTMESTATAIKPGKVDDQIFTLPANAQLQEAKN
jgi:hypothetical protein